MEVIIHDNPPDHVEKYDFCLVFPLIENNKFIDNTNVEDVDDVEVNNENILNISDEAYDIISKIIVVFGKSYVYQYDSIKYGQRFVLIRGSVSKLKTQAEIDKYELLLDHEKSKQVLMAGDPFYNIEPVYIPHDPPSTKLKPFDYIYGRYRSLDDIQSIYWRPKGMNHPFRRSIRIYYIHKILQDSERKNGIGLDLRLLHYNNIISSYYPIHTTYELSELERFWLDITSMPWNQPLFHLKEYFGIRIAYKFVYLDHLSDTLFLPAALGIAFQIIIFYYNDYNFPINPIFSLFICLWLINLSIFWLRREKLTSFCWGTSNFIEMITIHNIRPSFHGIIKQSPIDGTMVLNYNQYERISLTILSVSIMLILIGFSISTVIGTYIAYNYIVGHHIDSYRQWFVSGITGFTIPILNNLYYYICVWLTEIENHRIDAKYDRSLQVKYFILQFFNSYFSMYYLAFLSRFPRYIPHHHNAAAEAIRDSQRNVTMRVLAVNLVTIYGVRLFVNLIELLILFLITKKRTKVGVVETDRLNNEEVDYWNIYPQKTSENFDKDALSNDVNDVDDDVEPSYSSYNLKSKSKEEVMYDNPNKRSPNKKSNRKTDSEYDESENENTYVIVKKKSNDRIGRSSPRREESKLDRTKVDRSFDTKIDNKIDSRIDNKTDSKYDRRIGKKIDNNIDSNDEESYGMTSNAMEVNDDNFSYNTGNTRSTNKNFRMNRSVFTKKLAKVTSRRVSRRMNPSETGSQISGTRSNILAKSRSMRSRRNNARSTTSYFNDSFRVPSAIRNAVAASPRVVRSAYNNIQEKIPNIARSFSQIVSKDPGVIYGNESNADLTMITSSDSVTVEDDFLSKEYEYTKEEVFFYVDVIISYGFILIFGCLLPGIAGLGIIDMILLYRRNAFRLIHIFQRPMIKSIQSIGIWNNAFQLILSIAIVTNSGLILFTMTVFKFISLSNRIWLFFGFISFLYIVRYILSIWITIESKAVKLQQFRTQFLTSKLVEKISDAELDPTLLL